MGVLSRLHTRVRGTDRLMLASSVVAVLAVVWFTVNLWRPTGPTALLWLPIPVGGVIVVAIFWRTSRTTELALPVRRFWRLLTLVAALTGAAVTLHAVDVLVHGEQPGQRFSMAMHVLDGIAV